MSDVAEGMVELRNQLGLHIRPAGMVAKTALQFLSKITVTRGGDTVNARSIVALTTLGAPMGTVLKLRAEGPDAHQAIVALTTLFEHKFGED